MDKIFSIIVTYNGETWINRCLNNLLKSDLHTEIIVIDNASTDETLALLSNYPTIHLIQNKINTGFGQANNLGIDFAMKQGADFIFLLNQDAYVFENTISKLVNALKDNPDFGLLSPLQLEISGKAIEPIFKNFLHNNFSPEVANKMLISSSDFDVNRPYAMRFVNAAAWMISRECINKTGLFHPVFFHYGEDNHYASRVQYHGMKIGVLPVAHVIHDCKTETPDDYNLLIRKMKNIPIYTLLDLRKSFPLAYFLGFLKWRRLAKKLSKFKNTATQNIIDEQKKWFTSKLSQAIAIRKETKNPPGEW
ncbi:MAG: glycosyltransferase family 2 protein [Bacteroidota bacterium]|nr:glycosyltransferase family 2 protein [Bacteroidota bacterium]